MKNKLLVLLIFSIFSCNTKQENLKILKGNALGTTFSIRYLDTSNRKFDAKIDSLITVVNKSVSTYIPTSDISKINKGDTAIVVDDIFEEVFLKSAKIYSETNGDFDPTIGILVNAWGFGPGKPIRNLDSTKIKDLLQFVGFDKVSMHNKKIKKLYPEIYFDFNAIAKGYLVDVVGRLFERNHIKN